MAGMIREAGSALCALSVLPERSAARRKRVRCDMAVRGIAAPSGTRRRGAWRNPLGENDEVSAVLVVRERGRGLVGDRNGGDDTQSQVRRSAPDAIDGALAVV